MVFSYYDSYRNISNLYGSAHSALYSLYWCVLSVLYVCVFILISPKSIISIYFKKIYAAFPQGAAPSNTNKVTLAVCCSGVLNSSKVKARRTIMDDQQQFCLRWNDFQTNMVASFKHLRNVVINCVEFLDCLFFSGVSSFFYNSLFGRSFLSFFGFMKIFRSQRNSSCRRKEIHPMVRYHKSGFFKQRLR